MLILLVGSWRYNVWAEAADWDRRAPIIGLASTQIYGYGYCKLSPGGRFISLGTPKDPVREQVVRFFDTTNGQSVSIALPSDLLQSYPPETTYGYPSVGLRDELFLLYDRSVERTDRNLQYRAPSHGWLVEVTNRTVTNTDDLSPDLRAEYFALAAENNRRWSAWPGEGFSQRLKSPDGRFVASGQDNGMILDVEGRLRNRFVYQQAIVRRSSSALCQDGWRRDSAGIYIVEYRIDGEERVVRLLLAEPPAPPWYMRSGEVRRRWRELAPLPGGSHEGLVAGISNGGWSPR